MSASTKRDVGDVVEIALPSGRRAFGRVLRDASIAVYDAITQDSGPPPIGSRDYLFTVGIYEDALKKLPFVGRDPSRSSEDDWPPPYCVTDKITGQTSIYHHGAMRPADQVECAGLEPAAVWDLHHIIDRIESSGSEG